MGMIIHDGVSFSRVISAAVSVSPLSLGYPRPTSLVTVRRLCFSLQWSATRPPE
jgi:hypothetical protein